MKKSTTLILFLVSINFVIGQNLVPNGSFEEFYECPGGQGDFYTDIWYKVPYSRGTPDYFKDCSSEDTEVDVPDNIFGYQFPQEGEGYAGLFCYGDESMQREYIEILLESPLIEGQEYEFSMWVSLPEIYNYGLNNLGALFTDQQVEGNGQFNPSLIEADPQVKAETPIIDKENWTQITGTFIAEGGEEYLTLGNFFSDEDTETLYIGGGNISTRTHYYIDSVSLIPSNLGVNDNNFEGNINIYPNPVSEVLNINNLKSVNYTVKIFSLQGQLLKTDTSSSDKINVGDLKPGIYFIEITTLDGQKEVRKFVKQ